MPGVDRSDQEQILSLEELQRRLAEAEEILQAIRNGEVDAFVVSRSGVPFIQTLAGANHPYRVLIDALPEGAATLTADASIIYCNKTFVGLAGRPPDQMVRVSLFDLILPTADLGNVSVLVSIESLVIEDERQFYHLIVTDLREKKRAQAILVAERLTGSIFDQAVEAIIFCDPEGLIQRANQAAVVLCGQNIAGQLIGTALPLGRPRIGAFFKQRPRPGI